MNKAIFLDRDNTIIDDVPYAADPDKVVIMPGVVATLKTFSEAGYILIVITNQSGIGRGLFTEEDMNLVNEKMKLLFRECDIKFHDILYCPHQPEDNCECRKPSPKLIEEAAEKHNISLKNSVMIGDKVSDVESGIAAGCGVNILLKGVNKRNNKNLKNVVLVDSITEAVFLVKA
jgi:D-glycero-D-manno-heptose 1,7-bisphosphate phosphatase